MPGKKSLAPIITFLTDFGYADGYAAEMKGVILRCQPAARLVDISHAIAPFDVFAGAVVLGQVYASFPPGTIHVAVVDPGVGGDRAGLILEAGGHFFIGPDNGLFTLPVLNHKKFAAYRITRFRGEASPTFHGRDVFAPVAAALAGGQAPDAWGKRIRSVALLKGMHPRRVTAGNWEGKIIGIDHFGNCATNFPGRLWHPARRPVLMAGGREIRHLVGTFSAGKPGKPAIIVNSQNQLEIMIPGASAARKLKIRKYDKVFLRLQSPKTKHI